MPSTPVRRALDALNAIAHDPDETPERRQKAQAALDADLRRDLRPSIPAIGVPAAGNTGHHSSGGLALHSDAVYDGWDDQP